MGVKVTFLGNESKASQSVVRALVPQEAVRTDSGSQIVYLYHDGRVERRAVRVGSTRGNDEEIVAGLSGGDQVVISGFEGLHDGERVEVKK
jgi:multidrug efflux pump subunit AcrA (membrane-fusion protein)